MTLWNKQIPLQDFFRGKINLFPYIYANLFSRFDPENSTVISNTLDLSNLM